MRLDRFQLLLEPCELILKADGGVFCFGEKCFFLGDGFLQVVHHPGGIVAHLPDGVLDGGIEAGNFRVMTGAAGKSPPMIRPADIGRPQIGSAHGKHRTAAAPAVQQSGIGVFVFLYTAVIGAGALCAKLTGDGESTCVHDGLVVVLKDPVFGFVLFDIRTVDGLAGVLALPERTNIEIVIEDALHGDDTPCVAGLELGVLALRLFPCDLIHARRGDVLIGQPVCNAFIAPAGVVEFKHFPHDLCRRPVHLKRHRLGVRDAVAVGNRADPLAVRLPALDDAAHLFGGVRDGHLVHEKVYLNTEPIVVGGVVNAVTDGDDAYSRVAERFKLHKTVAVAAGKTRQIFDNENVILVRQHLGAHDLVLLALREGVAGAVTVNVQIKRTAGEILPDIVLNDGFLIFDGSVVPVFLEVNGNSRVAADGKSLFHSRFTSLYVGILFARYQAENAGNSGLCCYLAAHLPPCVTQQSGGVFL